MTSMITVSDDLVFSLSNAHFSYVFNVSQEGILEHMFFGGTLSEPLNVPRHNRRVLRHGTTMFKSSPNYSLNDTPLEYPCFGSSDYRQPAFHGVNADGNGVFFFHYLGHRLAGEKPKLDGLPSARGEGSESLIITLEDKLKGLQLELIYTIWPDHAVLSRSVRYKNLSDVPVQLQNIFSSALNFPAGDYELQHFYGTWAREFNAARMAVPQGRFIIDSARGTSSAAHSPYIALLEKGTNEVSGCCYGTTLIYSGNFSFQVETGEFEDVTILAGLNPFGFQWMLEPGETFSTPEALHAYSAKGLSGLSNHWHAFIREKITPKRFKSAPRPTYLNSWEAAYFDIDETKVLSLADKANEIDVEMLVLDDGWFEGRTDATSSLGDWHADRSRFPSGIPALAAKVKAKGLKFGIWFEPEMVSPKSQLYETHPDWILHVPGRTPSLGRNQLTLDLSRREVQNYIFDAMDDILSCGDIDYVKWDMNRNMTEVGSAALPPQQQGEVPHRYMLGLYKLLTRLTDKYPNILFENCASGGNRFDLGMLAFMPQGWISDMCDPIGRLSIINGASHLYPLDTMAAYIGPSPNHQNSRKTSLETRFNAGAFCAARGVSLSEADIEFHKSDLKTYMALAKQTANDMIGGQFYRLKNTGNETLWQYVTADTQTIYLAFFHILSAPNLPIRRARFQGLDPLAKYVLDGSGDSYRGDALMQAGLPLPQVSTGEKTKGIEYMPDGDFTSRLFVFRKMNG